MPGKVEDLMLAFKDFHPKLVRLLSYVEECGLWQLRDQDPLDEWVKDRAIVIGDAAHPMLPHMGQGGSQAIEDADMLAFCLRNVVTADQNQVNAALQRVFQLRFERATVCQEKSREQAFGKRQEGEQLNLTNGAAAIPALNPMQFASYIFSYKGAEDWAEQEEEEKRAPEQAAEQISNEAEMVRMKPSEKFVTATAAAS